EEYVRRAWERGWLPADLDREARRQELDPAARTALAELTAAELARYGNGLTPLWRRQLDALAAPAWAGTG
ncbi:aromatic acid decarboxylase, partial [Streptomyces sp. SID8385]|nr:aromatic acid decarboxylase [Streptomyces sp. SID8385]